MKSLEHYIDEAIATSMPKAKGKELDDLRKHVAKIASGEASMSEELKITPEIQTVLFAQAERLFKAGQYKQAAVVFALLASLDENNYDYLFSLAAARHMLKDFPGAIVAYKAAFYLDTTNPMPLFHLSDCFVNVEEFELAIFNIETAKNIAGNNPKYAAVVANAQLIQDKLLTNLKDFVAKGEAKYEKEKTYNKI